MLIKQPYKEGHYCLLIADGKGNGGYRRVACLTSSYEFVVWTILELSAF